MFILIFYFVLLFMLDICSTFVPYLCDIVYEFSITFNFFVDWLVHYLNCYEKDAQCTIVYFIICLFFTFIFIFFVFKIYISCLLHLTLIFYFVVCICIKNMCIQLNQQFSFCTLDIVHILTYLIGSSVVLIIGFDWNICSTELL